MSVAVLAVIHLHPPTLLQVVMCVGVSSNMLLYLHLGWQAGLCGFSMGGVHAGMTAALYPGPLAVVPLLAPRSASVAFVHGALREATAWRSLAEPVDEARRVRGPGAVAQDCPALQQ